MEQSRAAYYSELIFYPAVVSGFVVIELLADHPHPLAWLGTCSLGISLWTLIEYFLHRFVLHELPGIAQLHAMHHSRPSAFIGTPIWLSSVTLSTIVFLPLWRILGLEIAAGTTSGLILGYVWYLLIHDAVHRWSLKEGSWLRKARYLHLLHHRHPGSAGNFGVSTDFWDVVFHTSIRADINQSRSDRQSPSEATPWQKLRRGHRSFHALASLRDLIVRDR